MSYIDIGCNPWKSLSCIQKVELFVSECTTLLCYVAMAYIFSTKFFKPFLIFHWSLCKMTKDELKIQS
jgi:hypothetical protein